MEGHPHPGQAEVLLVEWLRLLLLLAHQERLQELALQKALEPMEDEPKRPEQALMQAQVTLDLHKDSLILCECGLSARHPLSQCCMGN